MHVRGGTVRRCAPWPPRPTRCPRPTGSPTSCRPGRAPAHRSELAGSRGQRRRPGRRAARLSLSARRPPDRLRPLARVSSASRSPPAVRRARGSQARGRHEGWPVAKIVTAEQDRRRASPSASSRRVLPLSAPGGPQLDNKAAGFGPRPVRAARRSSGAAAGRGSARVGGPAGVHGHRLALVLDPGAASGARAPASTAGNWARATARPGGGGGLVSRPSCHLCIPYWPSTTNPGIWSNPAYATAAVAGRPVMIGDRAGQCGKRRSAEADCGSALRGRIVDDRRQRAVEVQRDQRPLRAAIRAASPPGRPRSSGGTRQPGNSNA